MHAAPTVTHSFVIGQQVQEMWPILQICAASGRQRPSALPASSKRLARRGAWRRARARRDAAHVAAGYGKNKGQTGGRGRDGAVYGLPCRAPAVLRVSAEGEVTTLGGPWHGPEKWEGGVMDRESGVIYAMPDHGSWPSTPRGNFLRRPPELK